MRHCAPSTPPGRGGAEFGNQARLRTASPPTGGTGTRSSSSRDCPDVRDWERHRDLRCRSPGWRSTVALLHGLPLTLPPATHAPPSAAEVNCTDRDEHIGAFQSLGAQGAEGSQPPQRPDPGKEEIGAATDRRERRQPRDLPPNGPLRDCHVKRAVLVAYDRVAFVAELMEVRVVDPHVLRELELADEARTTHEGGDAPLHTILGRA